MEWTHYIEQVTEDQVWITDEDLHQAFDRAFMEERYGADVITEGRMCVRVGDEWAWRMTRWLPEEIAAIEKRAAEVAAFLEGGQRG